MNWTHLLLGVAVGWAVGGGAGLLWELRHFWRQFRRWEGDRRQARQCDDWNRRFAHLPRRAAIDAVAAELRQREKQRATLRGRIRRARELAAAFGEVLVLAGARR